MRASACSTQLAARGAARCPDRRPAALQSTWEDDSMLKNLREPALRRQLLSVPRRGARAAVRACDAELPRLALPRCPRCALDSPGGCSLRSLPCRAAALRCDRRRARLRFSRRCARARAQVPRRARTCALACRNAACTTFRRARRPRASRSAVRRNVCAPAATTRRSRSRGASTSAARLELCPLRTGARHHGAERAAVGGAPAQRSRRLPLHAPDCRGDGRRGRRRDDDGRDAG